MVADNTVLEFESPYNTIKKRAADFYIIISMYYIYLRLRNSRYHYQIREIYQLRYISPCPPMTPPIFFPVILTVKPASLFDGEFKLITFIQIISLRKIATKESSFPDRVRMHQKDL